VLPGQPGLGTATITEWNLAAAGSGEPVYGGTSLTVDFDPHTLELRYSVSPLSPGKATPPSGSATPSKAPLQWTSENTTLSLTLVFDSTATGDPVQQKTDALVALTRPSVVTGAAQTKPPAPATVVRFSWGAFCFYGSVTSMSQTIDYFSTAGVPLRATVELSLQEVAPPASATTASSSAAPATSFGAGVGIAGGIGASAGASASAGISASAGAGASASAGVSASVGVTPLTLSTAGDSVQGIAAQAGTSVSWKVVAAANNIDNPRILPPGTVLDLSAGASASAVAGAQVQIS
jgi:hypothetical protein